MTASFCIGVNMCFKVASISFQQSPDLIIRLRTLSLTNSLRRLRDVRRTDRLVLCGGQERRLTAMLRIFPPVTLSSASRSGSIPSTGALAGKRAARFQPAARRPERER